MSAAPTRPALRWHGGKWLLAPWIISFFPRHRVYVEPFGGAASVLLRKPRAHAEVYNDLDATVVNVFRVLRDPAKAAELARRLALTPYARAEFDLSYEPPTDDVDAAHKAMVRSFMGFGSDSITRTCRTGFRASLTGGAGAVPSREWGSFHELIATFTNRLRGVLIEQRPAVELFDLTDGADTLYFLDPPYILSTRTAMSNGRGAVHGYAHEMTDGDHERLLGRIRGIDGMVVLCGYPHPLYDRVLGGGLGAVRTRRPCRWRPAAHRGAVGQSGLPRCARARGPAARAVEPARGGRMRLSLVPLDLESANTFVRLCTDGTRNAASFLLGRAARATFALGYRRLGTYTLASESGTSLVAAGWRLVGEVRGRSWNTRSRPRVDRHPTPDKLRWEAVAPCG